MCIVFFRAVHGSNFDISRFQKWKSTTNVLPDTFYVWIAIGSALLDRIKKEEEKKIYTYIDTSIQKKKWRLNTARWKFYFNFVLSISKICRKCTNKILLNRSSDLKIDNLGVKYREYSLLAKFLCENFRYNFLLLSSTKQHFILLLNFLQHPQSKISLISKSWFHNSNRIIRKIIST